MIQIPLSAEELLEELSSIKFNTITLDEMVSVLAEFDVASNPAIFTMIFACTGLDVGLMLWARWRWARRRKGKHRKRVVVRQQKRDPEFQRKRAALEKEEALESMRTHARALVIARQKGVPLGRLPAEVRVQVAAIYLQTSARGRSSRVEHRGKKAAVTRMQACARGHMARSSAGSKSFAQLAVSLHAASPKAAQAGGELQWAGHGSEKLMWGRSGSSMGNDEMGPSQAGGVASSMRRPSQSEVSMRRPSQSEERRRALIQTKLEVLSKDHAANPGRSRLVRQPCEPDQQLGSVQQVAHGDFASVLPSASGWLAAAKSRSARDRVAPNNPKLTSPPPSPPTPQETDAMIQSLMRATRSSQARDSPRVHAVTATQNVLDHQRALAARFAQQRSKQPTAGAAAVVTAGSTTWMATVAGAAARATGPDRQTPLTPQPPSPRPPSQSQPAPRRPPTAKSLGATSSAATTPRVAQSRISRVPEESVAEDLVEATYNTATTDGASQVSSESNGGTRLPTPQGGVSAEMSSPPAPQPIYSQATSSLDAMLGDGGTREVAARHAPPENSGVTNSGVTNSGVTNPDVTNPGVTNSGVTILEKLKKLAEVGREEEKISKAARASQPAVTSFPQDELRISNEISNDETRLFAQALEAGTGSSAADTEAKALNLFRRRLGRVSWEDAVGEAQAERSAAGSRWAALRKPGGGDSADGLDGTTHEAPPAARKLWEEARRNALTRAAANAFDVGGRMGLMSKEYDVHREMQLQDFKAKWKAARARGPHAMVAFVTWQATRRMRATIKEFITQLQHEHTIVSAVAPAAEDTAGDHLHDENVIHIFFTTMLGELCVICFLRGGDEDVALISLTTFINGLITTGICASLAMVAKKAFRFGNKRRWRAPYKPTLLWRLVRQLWRVPLKLHRRVGERRAKNREEAAQRHRTQMRQKMSQSGARHKLKLKMGRDGQLKIADDTKLKLGRNGQIAIAVVASAKRSQGWWSQAARTSATTSRNLGTLIKLAVGPTVHTRRWVEIPRRLRTFRFTMAWGFNIALYLVAAWTALTFGVMYDEPAFAEILLAWLAGLAFTWLVIEPSEVAGLILFPRLFDNERVAYCRNKCKEIGIYG